MEGLELQKILAIFILLWNILVFFLYGLDKRRAIKGAYRISEIQLLTAAFLGGAVGAYVGMVVFHHKTKHWKFKILVPFFVILQVSLLSYYVWSKILG